MNCNWDVQKKKKKQNLFSDKSTCKNVAEATFLGLEVVTEEKRTQSLIVSA